ncbi:hypothetical protein ACFXQA_10325 [Microbacterium sp. P07]|uniref:hypothetical protein n=1 Tax=Microbacterium sp. P07 TaxID=3366952 RepID=UPI003746CCB1
MADDLDFSVVLDDFTKDAETWREINAYVETSHSAAAGVETVPFGVTDGISYAAGFKEQYDRLAGSTVTYLKGGHGAIESIAVALEDTRKEYLASDEYAEWLANQ